MSMARIARRVRELMVTVSLLAGLLGAALARAGDVASAIPPVRALPPEALAIVRRLAVQHNGRHKPFESFARETLQMITGSPQIGHDDPVRTVVSILAEPEAWQAAPLMHIPFRPLREPLGMAPRASHISYNELVATRKLMRMLPAIVQKQQREEKLTMLEQETMDVYERFVSLSALFERNLVLVPPPSGRGASWLPIFEAEGFSSAHQDALRSAWTSFLDAVQKGDGQATVTQARQLSTLLRSANAAAYPASWRLTLEVGYHHVAPFRIAWIFYLLACALLSLGLAPARRRLAAVGTGLCLAAFVVHGGGIATRVILGGRPPVSNFFETMLWLPFVAVTLALVFERLSRVRPSTRPSASLRTVPSAVEGRYFALAASLLAAITLMLSEHVPLDASISPVVAVLRSNLWLTIHVLTIVASYGVLALATVLAHLMGVLALRRADRARLAALEPLLYRTLQVGVVLLAGGIMLGAVWANASWGRYWGWDPKETWALITLLWFLAVLHGRSAGWLTGVTVALCTITGFFLLLMTYYGVSFYLVGLHSYAGGHAKPIPALLIGYVAAEALFVALVAWRAFRPAVSTRRKTA